MKKEQAKYKYFRTLWESVDIVMKNPVMLLPFVLSSIAGFLYLPFVIKMQEPAYMLENLPVFIISVLIGCLWSVMIYGWTLSMLNQFFSKKEIKLWGAFRRSLSFGLRALAAYILIFILIFLAYVLVAFMIDAAGSLLSLINIAVVGAILGFILGLLFIVLFILFLTAIWQIIPLLAVEDKGVIATIKEAAKFYLKKKLYSLNIFLVSGFFMILLSIPALIYQYNVIADFVITATFVYSVPQLLTLAALYIIPNLFLIVIFVYYCRSYLIKKATIREK